MMTIMMMMMIMMMMRMMKEGKTSNKKFYRKETQRDLESELTTSYPDISGVSTSVVAVSRPTGIT